MANIFVQEEFVNATDHYRSGSSDPEESSFATKGEVFRFCLKKFGKCVSKVYVDRKSGKPRAIGWIFEKLVKYDDCNKKFLQEAWITLHKAPCEHKTIYHYL